MPTEGANIENLLERVIQMNMLIIEEMQEQRKQISQQQTQILTQLAAQPLTSNHVSVNPSSQLFNKITVKPKEFNGTSDENIITWLTSLEEIMGSRLVTDDERMSVAVSLLGGTALQWFVNLKLKQQRPASWHEFREKIISQFQTVDFPRTSSSTIIQIKTETFSPRLYSVFSKYCKSDQ